MQSPPATPTDRAAANSAVRAALLHLQHSIVSMDSQLVRQVGPRPGRHEVALRACVGLVPECEFGPYGSEQRLAAERELISALGRWAASEGAARPSGEAGCGWTLECKWAGGRGSRKSALDVRPVGGPSSAAMLQLRQWLTEASIRVPLPSDPSRQAVVPCHACPGDLPLGQVQVTLRGLPSFFMLKDTVGAILRAVGYTGQPGAGRRLCVTEVFRGWHADEPHLADGSLCAFVDQPEDDPELWRLPPSVHLGHGQAVVEVLVSSRRATFVGPTPPQQQQPPPPPPRQQPAAAAAPEAPATSPAPAVPAGQAPAGQAPAGQAPAGQAPAGQAPAGQAAVEPPQEQPGSGTATDEQGDAHMPDAETAAQLPAASDALDLAAAQRPEAARLLRSWARDAFGHSASPAQVRHILANAVATIQAVRTQVQRLADTEGEMNWHRPPEALQRQLIVAFGEAGHSMATYEAALAAGDAVDAVGGARRSARLASRGRSSEGREPQGGGREQAARRSRSRSRGRPQPE